ncbi:hypothetical protein LTS14_001314, partial [Recurvomyces mirabilis]|uniref:uncharacterized protein n=1 Tax=Recurvomyces mirabilis TaxID=574656 RepID=UPI002DDE0AB3
MQRVRDSEHCHCCARSFRTSDEEIESETFSAFAELWDRSWFSRLWVIQEANTYLDKVNMYCGSHWVRLERYLSVLSFDFIGARHLDGSDVVLAKKLRGQHDDELMMRHPQKHAAMYPKASWRKFATRSSRKCSAF